jgi:ribonuclease PH
MRPIKVTKNFINSAENSVLYESGNTKVLVTVSVSTKLPDWMQNSEKGWVTAEYNMLPGSSGSRISRKSFESGRSKEISRLIGRSLRAVCTLGVINGYSFTVDCDVLEADGGTRTASINGAWIALNDTFEKMIQENKLIQNPLSSKVGALSVGIVDGELVADLDYENDSKAEVDLNLVLNQDFDILEIQGTAEGKPFSKSHLDNLFELAKENIEEIFKIQDKN